MPFVSRARFATDARAIVALGGPLLGNNLSLTGMSFADTVMAGQLGARELAGLAIGVAYYHIFLFAGLGVLLAVSPMVAHAYGARDDVAVTRYARQSWWLSAALAVIVVAGMLQAQWVLERIGIQPQILPIAVGYAYAVCAGLPALMLFLSLRYTSEGLGRTKPIMYIGFLGLVVNVFGNWVFMYGRFGAPALGAVGCGVATAITFWIMLIAMWLHMRTHAAYRRFELFKRIDPPHARVIGELTRIGAPIAGSLTAEGGLFVAAALMMGAMDAVSASGHQIAINYASFTFMIPLAISSATTIHVGHLLGRGERENARAAGLLGIALCGAVMMVSAVVIFVFREAIVALYTPDAAVRSLAAALLLYAALFQISDGVQVGAAGALRGFKDTAIPMALCVVSYWCVGFVLAYGLGVRGGGGPVGVWIGLTVGLTVSAVFLVARYRQVTGRSTVER